MAGTKRDVGKSVLETFLAKLPGDLQSTAADLFGRPEAVEALDVLGEHAMLRSDYSRTMNETQAENQRLVQWRASLEQWHQGIKDLATLGEKAQAAGWTPDGDPTPPANPAATLPPDVVRRADVEKLLAERELGYAGFAASLNALSMKHYQTFGEVLDIQALLQDPQVAKVGILGVYDTTFKDRYAEKAKAADDARVNTLVEARLAEARKSGLNPRFPSAGPQETSPLDALEAAQNKPGTGADDLADEYMNLVQKSFATATP